MEQHEANELYALQASHEQLTRRLDSARDVIRAAQKLTDVIHFEKLMSRPNQTHSVSSGGPFDSAHRNLIDALNHYWLPNGTAYRTAGTPNSEPIITQGDSQ